MNEELRDSEIRGFRYFSIADFGFSKNQILNTKHEISNTQHEPRTSKREPRNPERATRWELKLNDFVKLYAKAVFIGPDHHSLDF